MKSGSLVSSHNSSLFKVWALALLVLCPILLWGQGFYGGIRGRVVDPSGGAVANAKVTMTDQATNVSRDTVTNDAGEYSFAQVTPATYRVTVEVAGFKKFERGGVIVETQTVPTVDVTLEVGAVTESVQVTEDVSLIESEKADTGQVLDRQKIQDLPNLGRNPWLIMRVSNGVANAGDPRFNRMQDQSGSSVISIGGGMVRGNNYLIDGVLITDMVNRAVIVPTLETVQEVKVQVHTYDAEMGRTSGGMFNMYMKSGANELHGAAFGFVRPDIFYANTYFANASGNPNAPSQPYKNYGGAFGGPLLIPGISSAPLLNHLIGGKNKTFFWVAGEAYRQRSVYPQGFALPTAAEVGGNFSGVNFQNGSPLVIYNPLSTDANGNRIPFANNTIPGNMINPVGAALASYYPINRIQNAPGYYGAIDYEETATLQDRADQTTAKLDENFAPWWRASGAYLHYGSREPGQHFWGGPASPNGASWTLLRNVDATVINNTFTPNPTTVIAVRFGYNRFPNFQTRQSAGFQVTSLGFPASYAATYQFPQFPYIAMQDINQLGGCDGAGAQAYYSRNLLGSIAKFVGRHNLKAGMDFSAKHADFISYDVQSFNFDRTFTGATPTSSNSGADLADLLLGYPSGGTAYTEAKFFTEYRYYGGYFQDDFKLTPKLTLNMGLRYEWETGLMEANRHMITQFNASQINPINGALSNYAGVPLPNGGVQPIVATGGAVFAGTNGAPVASGNPTKTKFGPRVGVAWAANPKTTVRGGFGVFWVPFAYGQGTGNIGGYGFASNTNYVASNDGGVTPANSLSNPFPNGYNVPAGTSLGLLTQLGSNISLIDPSRRGGYVYQFSADVQRQLPFGIAATLGYSGSRGYHLPLQGSGSNGQYNVNELSPAYYSLGVNALQQAVPNPFYGNGGRGIIGNPTVSVAQLLLPFPEFGQVEFYGPSFGQSRYDALVARAEKRLSQGLTFLMAFTWARNMDNLYAESSGSFGSPGGYQTKYNFPAEFAPSIVDQKYRMTGTISYDLPFGKGKHWLNNNRAMDYAIGGWAINTVLTYTSGFPLNVIQSPALNSILSGGGGQGCCSNMTQRPNATGVNPNPGGSTESRLNGWYNPAAFSTAPALTFGDLSRTILYRGPGVAQWDISVFKGIKFAEKWTVQFRAESINAFNTPAFGNSYPNNQFGKGSFGVETNQGNFARLIQMGVRFMF